MTSTTNSAACTDSLPTSLSYDEIQRRLLSPGKVADDRIAHAKVAAVRLDGCTTREDENGNFIVMAPGYPHPVASDYPYVCEGASSRLEKTWQILAGRPAAWKTVGMLNTLRKAIREWHVQMMSLDLPRDGASKREVHYFLSMARHFDAIHHGAVTF